MAEGMRIAVIGRWEQILLFRALGIETFPAADAGEAGARLRELAAGNYGVIFLAEELAGELETILTGDRERSLPVILPLPGQSDAGGTGRRRLEEAVRRAIGAEMQQGTLRSD